MKQMVPLKGNTMKSFNKVLVVMAVSMTALVGMSANAQQPWSGEQPVFDNFSNGSGVAANRAEVQAQARQAIADYAFSDGKNSQVVSNTQASQLSRAEVHAQAIEAVRSNRIAVGE